MEAIPVGFQEEYSNWHARTFSLRAAPRATSQPDEALMVLYLCSGWVAMTTGPSLDPLDQADYLIEHMRILTDGLWWWPSSYPYFVAKYHVVAPPPFVERMREYKWQPPRVHPWYLEHGFERLPQFTQPSSMHLEEGPLPGRRHGPYLRRERRSERADG